jgi:general secretion pathway protein B
MSYILDALRRADSERERGRVPGIHAQPLPSTSADAARRAPPPWIWIVVGLSLGLLVALGWTMWGRDAPPLPPAGEVAGLPPPPPPAEAPGERALPAPPPPAPEVARPAEPPPVAPIERRPTSTDAARKAPPSRGAAASAPPESAPRAAAAAATGDTRIHARHELPDEIRRQLPALSIGGSIYSPSPANRFVVINGVVVREGGEVGPDHVLEQIKLKSAVLRFKGYRYEILY